MTGRKKVIVLTSISVVLVAAAVVLFAVFILTIKGVVQLPTWLGGGSKCLQTSEIPSSGFDQKVAYPNDYEGRVQVSWLDSYVIGRYKAEYENYDNLLSDAGVVQTIADVIDPALTAAAGKFPNAQVAKDIYNGVMTVWVNEFVKMRNNGHGGPGEDSRESAYGNPVYGLNFDLHTGERITLRSVFADGFDVQTAVDKAVQPYVLALDEQNIRKCKDIDLVNTDFCIDKEGVWLIFDRQSPFLANQSIYVEWYKFGEGAVAIFDRFPPLAESEISKGFRVDYHNGNRGFETEYLFRSEPKYLIAQNTYFYLPTDYENDYERQLAERVKDLMFSLMTEDSGYPLMTGGHIAFDRIGRYRIMSKRNLSHGIYDIKEKREITPAEYYGNDYKEQALSALHDIVADHEKEGEQLVSDEEFLQLIETATWTGGVFAFSRPIYKSYAAENDQLWVKSDRVWWK
jgi:hypothetical protein